MFCGASHWRHCTLVPQIGGGTTERPSFTQAFSPSLSLSLRTSTLTLSLSLSLSLTRTNPPLYRCCCCCLCSVHVRILPHVALAAHIYVSCGLWPPHTRKLVFTTQSFHSHWPAFFHSPCEFSVVARPVAISSMHYLSLKLLIFIRTKFSTFKECNNHNWKTIYVHSIDPYSLIAYLSSKIVFQCLSFFIIFFPNISTLTISRSH